jgi:hypothetical protein
METKSIIRKTKSHLPPISSRSTISKNFKSHRKQMTVQSKEPSPLQKIIDFIYDNKTTDYDNDKYVNDIMSMIRRFIMTNGNEVNVNKLEHLLLRFLREIKNFNEKKQDDQINKIRRITQTMQEQSIDAYKCYDAEYHFCHYVDGKNIKKEGNKICVNALSISGYAKNILKKEYGYNFDETTGGSKKTKQFSKKYIPKHLTEKDKKKQSDMLKKSIKMYEKKQYINRNHVESFKTRKSPHIKKAKELYNVKKITPNKQLAKATGCSVKALSDIVKKGQGAYYSSGSRPNQTAHSWGIARLASAITAGKSAKVDYHILEKGCDKKKKALQLAKNLQKK